MTWRRIAFGLGLFLLASGGVACLLTDPSPPLTSPIHRPVVLHGQEFPSAARPLVDLPDTFFVSVEVDPTIVEFHWLVRVDGSNSGQENSPRVNGENRIHVEFPNPIKGVEKQYCHTIEFIASLNQVDVTDGDSIVWYYTPNATFGGVGCFSVDAAIPEGSYDSGLDGGLE